MLRRLLASSALAAGMLLLLAPPANGHALLASSDPADGARIEAAPDALTLAFTEAPELSLSEVQVLGEGGASAVGGPLEVSPGDPLSLTLPLDELKRGVYTVTWSVVSKVDGHPSGGVFAFGLGVEPGVVAGSGQPQAPDPSVAEMAGRWALFIGLGLLVGASWIGVLAFREPPRGDLRLALGAAGVSAAGLVLLVLAQNDAAGAGIGALLGTSIGRALVWRAIGITVAVAATVLALRSGRGQRLALALAGAAAAGVMLTHVAAGHAAAGEPVALEVGAQWVHFLAGGIWLGGLAALVTGIRGEPRDEKSRAIRRFSAVALFALIAVGATGVVRALDEIGSWGELFTTGYGRVVLLKAALLLVLLGLGALNRYRNVPRTDRSLRGLRMAGGTELSIGAGVLAAAAILATLVPPKQVPVVSTREAGVTVTATDFATTMRAELLVTPGTAGPNTFTLELADYDTEDPLTADRVALRFTHSGLQLGETTLELAPTDEGVYEASGSNLSLGGLWNVTALVQSGLDAVEIPLEVGTLCRPTRIPGKGDRPTVNLVEVPGLGSVEGYTILVKGPTDEIHFTFLGEDGRPAELEDEPTILASFEGAPPRTLAPAFFSKAHFSANEDLRPGAWRFDGSAETGNGSLAGCFEQTIEP